MEYKNVLNSPRLLELKKQRRRDFRNKVIIFCFGLAFLFAGSGFLSRISKLNISGVTITGNKVVDEEKIREVVEADLAGHYFWIFPKTNIFFYPKYKIKTDLADKLKRLDTISIGLSDARALEIGVTERDALYTWCGDSRAIASDSTEKCFFLDKVGYIFDEAPYFSGDVYFRFYGKVSEDSLNPLGAYVSKDNFAKLALFKDTLDSIGIKPVSMYLENDEDGVIYLGRQGSSTNEPKIMFKIADDLAKVAENLQTAITTEPLHSDFRKKYSSLLYLDLRFGNKVYFKFE